MTASTAVVICEPLRTPVGRMGGALAPLSAAELATAALARTRPPDRPRRGRRRRRDPRQRLPQRRGAGDRPDRRARRRPGHRRARACRSTAAAARACRRCCTPRRRSPPAPLASSSPAARSRCRTSSTTPSACAPASDRAASQLMDRLDRARETAGGTAHPVPGGMIETAENLRAPVRHLPRGAGRARGALPPARRRRSRGRAVRRRDGRRSPFPASAASPTSSSTATSTPAPTPPSRRSAALRPIRVKVDPESTVTAGNA